MTDDQALNELRKELAVNSRIADLLKQCAKAAADERYNQTASTLDHSMLVKLTSEAVALNKFAANITKSPVAAATLRR